jgi:8-oxo-dGTP pyrophosphatase MutT (NUDIX family)
MASPPVLAKRTLACENSRFSVFLDELTGQGWPSISDYLVVAPKQVSDNLVTGVAVLPICEGKIGLIKAYRHAIQGESWEIPRGFIEKDESVPASALRELEEETGLSCDPGEIKFLGFVTPDAGILAARVQVYAALRCKRIRPYGPTEVGHREFRLFYRADIDDLISRAEIQDPCTAVAYYRYITLAEPPVLGRNEIAVLSE